MDIGKEHTMSAHKTPTAALQIDVRRSASMSDSASRPPIHPRTCEELVRRVSQETELDHRIAPTVCGDGRIAKYENQKGLQSVRIIRNHLFPSARM
jgi:hypothetical protein